MGYGLHRELDRLRLNAPESLGESSRITANQLAQFELTVKGVPWGIPAGGDAGFGFSADLGIPAPLGTYSVPSSFGGFFLGAPEPFSSGLGCDGLNCVTLAFSGGGILTYDVVDAGGGWFAVGQETFTFAAVPEPPRCPCSPLGSLVWRCGGRPSLRSTRHS